METTNMYSEIIGKDIIIMVPSKKPFWNPILWTFKSVEMKVFGFLEVSFMICKLQQFDNCCEHIKKIDINKQPNSDELNKIKDFLLKKGNLEKIEEYLLKTHEYTLIKCVYKHYEILSQKLPEDYKLFVHIGITNSRNVINIDSIDQTFENKNSIGEIQYCEEENTPEIIEEMLLKIIAKKI